MLKNTTPLSQSAFCEYLYVHFTFVMACHKLHAPLGYLLAFVLVEPKGS